MQGETKTVDNNQRFVSNIPSAWFMHLIKIWLKLTKSVNLVFEGLAKIFK